MRFLFFFIFIVNVLAGYAQADTTRTGEIISGEVLIEKEKKLTLSIKTKPFVTIPFKDFTSKPPQITFPKYTSELVWPRYREEIPLRQDIKKNPKPPYQDYVKVGFGNFSSPLLEAGLYQSFGDTDLRSRLFYESFGKGPVNKKNSANSRANIDVDAHIPVGVAVLSPFISTNHLGYRFFGNTAASAVFPEGDLGRVGFNSIKFGGKLQKQQTMLSYSVGLSLDLNKQSFSGGSLINKENGFRLFGDLSYDLLEEHEATLSVGYNNSGYDGNGLNYSRSLFTLKPMISRRNGNFSWKAGFEIASNNVGKNTMAGFYPKAEVSRQLDNSLTASAYFDSNITWTNLTDLIGQNQFLDDSLLILNTVKKWGLGAGIEKKTDRFVGSAKISYAAYADLPIFVPSTSDSTRYRVMYDDNIKNLNLDLSLTYLGDDYNSYNLGILLNQYSTTDLEKPWHLPLYEIRLNTRHIIMEALVINTYFVLMGGIKAPVNTLKESVSLDPFIDPGFSVSYLINERFSVFVSADNLMGNEYQRYLGYPVRGLAFKFGGKYRF